MCLAIGSPRSFWTEKVVDLENDSLIEENSVPDYQIVYTDESVQRGVKSGCRYTASLHCEVVKQDSGYISLTTSSICVEIKAITEILE